MSNCFGIKEPEEPIVQVRLVGDGGKQMITWVDARKDLSRGRVITLKKRPNEQWLVEEVYSDTVKSSKDFDFHRKWDNNNYDQHKGLGL